LSVIVVMMTQITLNGQNTTVGGTGSKGLNANLQFADSTEFDNNAGSTLWLNITSTHYTAWENYFNRTLSGAGLTYGVGKGYTINKIFPHLFADKSKNYYTLMVKIFNVKVLDHTKANVNANIGELSMI